MILPGALNAAEGGSLPHSCRQRTLALELSSGKLLLTHDPPHPSAVLYNDGRTGRSYHSRTGVAGRTVGLGVEGCLPPQAFADGPSVPVGPQPGRLLDQGVPRPTWLWPQHSQTRSSPTPSGETSVAPRPLLFVLQNGKAGPLGQESSGRQEHSGLAVTASLALSPHPRPTQVAAHTRSDDCSARQCPSVPAAPTPREPDSRGESPAARHFLSFLSAESEARSATLCQPRAGERVHT